MCSTYTNAVSLAYLIIQEWSPVLVKVASKGELANFFDCVCIRSHPVAIAHVSVIKWVTNSQQQNTEKGSRGSHYGETDWLEGQ